MFARTSLLIVSLALTGGTGRSAPPAQIAAAHHHTPDVRELLGSARTSGV